MANSVVEQERVAFEAFMRSEGWADASWFARRPDGVYRNSCVLMIWMGWAARARIAHCAEGKSK